MRSKNLPDDILALVFDVSAVIDRPHPSWCKYKWNLGWVRLSHVCHRWRTLLLNSPLLWAQVVLNFRSESARAEALKRSCNLPLSLYLPEYFVCRDPCFPVELCNSLLQQARVIFEPYADAYERKYWTTLFRGPSLAGLTLPLLEELTIANCGNDHTRPLVTPSLQSLVVRGIPWLIQAPLLRSLKIELRLYDSNRLSHHVVKLPMVISSSPMLVEVTLGIIGYDIRNISRDIQHMYNLADNERNGTVMRHLTSLNIDGDTPLVSMLMRNIRVPDTSRVQLRLRFLDDLFQSTTNIWEITQLYRLDPKYDILTLPRGHGETAILSHNSDPCMCILKNGDTFDASNLHALKYFAAFPDNHLRTLRITGHLPQVEGYVPKVPSGFARAAYPLIESLDVSGRASYLAHIVALYTFPRLRNITLDVGEYYDYREMKRLSAVLLARPVKLELLVLRGKTSYMDEATLAKEVKILRLHEAASTVLDQRGGLFLSGLVSLPKYMNFSKVKGKSPTGPQRELKAQPPASATHRHVSAQSYQSHSAGAKSMPVWR